MAVARGSPILWRRLYFYRRLQTGADCMPVLLLEGTSMRFPQFSLEILMAVVATAEKKSVTRAGKELGISPSAVTKRIRVAERIARVVETGSLLPDVPSANHPNQWMVFIPSGAEGGRWLGWNQQSGDVTPGLS